MFRDDYTIPSPLAEMLLSTLLHHPFWSLGKVYCMRDSELGSEKIFKIVPSEAYMKAIPDCKQIDIWKSIFRSEAARRSGTQGAFPGMHKEVYVCMHYRNTPLLPPRDALTSMS